MVKIKPRSFCFEVLSSKLFFFIFSLIFFLMLFSYFVYVIICFFFFSLDLCSFNALMHVRLLDLLF